MLDTTLKKNSRQLKWISSLMPTCKEAALEDWQLGADGRKVPTSCSVPGPHAWTYAGQWSLKKSLVLYQSRPERWIVTIPLSDQWLATIGNHWKTIVSNGRRTIKPLKNHCYQWFLDPKTIGKPLLPMVLVTKNH